MMIVCWKVQNFRSKYLVIWLSTCGIYFSTPWFHAYLFYFRELSYLSTKIDFGAKLISLYLFTMKNGWKLIKKQQTTLQISPIFCFSFFVCANLNVYPQSYEQVFHRVINNFFKGFISRIGPIWLIGLIGLIWLIGPIGLFLVGAEFFQIVFPEVVPAIIGSHVWGEG